MINLVKLNSWDSNVPAYVNMDNVKVFLRYKDNPYTLIYFNDKNNIRVKETPEEIIELINEVK